MAKNEVSSFAPDVNDIISPKVEKKDIIEVFEVEMMESIDSQLLIIDTETAILCENIAAQENKFNQDLNKLKIPLIKKFKSVPILGFKESDELSITMYHNSINVVELTQKRFTIHIDIPDNFKELLEKHQNIKNELNLKMKELTTKKNALLEMNRGLPKAVKSLSARLTKTALKNHEKGGKELLALIDSFKNQLFVNTSLMIK